MTQETNGSARRGLILAAAATALTVAAGLTAGTLLGWVGPSRAPSASAAIAGAPPVEAPLAPLAARDTASAGDAAANADGSPAAGQDPAPAEAALAEPARGGERGEEAREHGERGRREHGEHERREHERGGDDDD